MAHGDPAGVSWTPLGPSFGRPRQRRLLFSPPCGERAFSPTHERSTPSLNYHDQVDDEIRAALRRNDLERAFALVSQHHGPAVFTRCFHILGDRAQAEDALQETLVVGFRKRAELAAVASIRAWLMRVAVNKALDAHRRDRRQRAKLERQVRLDVDADAAGAAVGDSLGSFDRAKLDECLAALDSVTRAAFLLRYEDELAWEQIAATVELPVDTIRMRVQRGALRSLRVCLGEGG